MTWTLLALQQSDSHHPDSHPSDLHHPALQPSFKLKQPMAMAASALLASTGLMLAAQGLPAQAQSPLQPSSPAETQAPPTLRYGQGETVNLADIVEEWRGYYVDIPVYQCVCQDDTCRQTEQWPFREFYQYQFTVALGPTNGQFTESKGFNCFDIADGSRPSNPRAFSEAQVGQPTVSASSPPQNPATDLSPSTRPVETPPASATPVAPQPSPAVPASPSPGSVAAVPASSIPKATMINEGAAIQLDWPSGASNVIAVTGSNWNINVLDALDCDRLNTSEQKMMEAQRVVGPPAVDGRTGHVAVPVLLSSCVETDQSAVFILDPSEGGGYSLYRAQLGGDRTLPNEFSSYPFNTILGSIYWDGDLYVRQGTASSAEAVMVFRSGQTPAGEYAGCAVVTAAEGADRLCN